MNKTILTVALHIEGTIPEPSVETAAFARSLGERTGLQVSAVMLGSAEDLGKDFAARSGLDTLILDHPSLAVYTAENYVRALDSVIARLRPAFILIPHTAIGWDFSPGLAARIGASCITGAASMGEGNPPPFIRRVMGGKLEAEERVPSGRAAVITVLPGAGKVIARTSPGKVTVEKIEMEPSGARNLGYIKPERGSLDLTRAKVIVAVGRGMTEVEKLGMVRELAQLFDGGAVGASRPVVDAGWLPLEHQVGQTGQTVRPKLYIALGISGALQHAAGMKDSEVVVAVNRDPDAPIFQYAHLGAAFDLNLILPALIEALRKNKTGSSGD